MSETATTPQLTVPDVPASVMREAAAFSVANVTGSPLTTVIGGLYVVQGVIAQLPGGNFPTTAAGWLNLVNVAIIGFLAALAKGG